MGRESVVFYLNGRRIDVQGENALKPLAYFLRSTLDLSGTKTVCSEGDCGACTLLVAPFLNNQFQKFRAINSCIAPVYSVHLGHVVTVEGVALGAELSEVQKAMVEMGNDPQGQQLLKAVNIKMLEKAHDAEYDGVRKMNLPLEVK